LILEWIENNRVTPVLVDIFGSFGGEHGWYGDNRTLPEVLRTLSSNDFSEVLSATLLDIEKQSRSGSLLSNDLFDKYLYLWKRVAADEEPKEYLEGVLGPERGLTELLRAYVTRTSSYLEGWSEKPEESEHPELRVQLLEVFDLVDEARAHAEGLLHNDSEWLSRDDRVLLRAFINGCFPGEGGEQGRG
jgi:hypothetical protein